MLLLLLDATKRCKIISLRTIFVLLCIKETICINQPFFHEFVDLWVISLCRISNTYHVVIIDYIFTCENKTRKRGYQLPKILLHQSIRVYISTTILYAYELLEGY